MKSRAILIEESIALKPLKSLDKGVNSPFEKTKDSKLKICDLGIRMPEFCNHSVAVFTCDVVVQAKSAQAWVDALISCGISAVIGESFPKEFHMAARGLEIYESEEATHTIGLGDQLQLDFSRKIILNQSQGLAYVARSIPSFATMDQTLAAASTAGLISQAGVFGEDPSQQAS